MTELRYGNLTKELQSQLEVKNIFTEYLAEFSFIEYPNYYESSQEIISIIKAQESAEKSGKWEAIKAFCDLWDADLISALEKTLDMLGIPFDDEYIEYLTKVTEDLGVFTLSDVGVKVPQDWLDMILLIF